MEKTKITVEVNVTAPLEKCWEYWTEPDHIVKWNNASEDWHTPFAENDLKNGGKFLFRMEAKDGSFGFNFEGVYQDIKKYNLIKYSIIDGRNVEIIFQSENNSIKITESFEAEEVNSIELQKQGWQSILNNYKKYIEQN